MDLPGGIEKAIVSTANLFAQKGYKVSLLVSDNTAESFYAISQNISVFNLDIKFGIGEKGNPITRKLSFFRDITTLRKKLDDISPSIVISTEYVFTIVAYYAKRKNVKLFSWEHHHFYHLQKSWFWKFLSARIYPKINKVVCLNRDEAALFKKMGCETYVIPNFPVPANKHAALTEKKLLTIGWLSKTKGTDLIPEIASIVFRKHPEWKWKIIGEGDGIVSLKNHSAIEVIKPSSPDIMNEYLNSSIYVLPSRLECFPLVLLEAMSAGVPCAAFNCPTGPKHIINDGVDGFLVETENVEAMANAISNLIEDETKRKQLGSNAFENIRRFSADLSFRLWEQLFNAAS